MCWFSILYYSTFYSLALLYLCILHSLYFRNNRNIITNNNRSKLQETKLCLSANRPSTHTILIYTRFRAITNLFWWQAYLWRLFWKLISLYKNQWDHSYLLALRVELISQILKDNGHLERYRTEYRLMTDKKSCENDKNDMNHIEFSL